MNCCILGRFCTSLIFDIVIFNNFNLEEKTTNSLLSCILGKTLTDQLIDWPVLTVRSWEEGIEKGMGLSLPKKKNHSDCAINKSSTTFRKKGTDTAS
jgi:hypothetical protein